MNGVPGLAELATALPAVAVHRGAVLAFLTPEVDAVVFPIAPGSETPIRPGPGTAELVTRYGIDLFELAERLELRGAAGEVHTVQLPRALGGTELPWAGLPPRLVLVGVGSADARSLRRAGEAIAGATTGLRRVVTTVGSDADADGARAMVEGYLTAAFPARGATRSAELLVLVGPHQAILERARHAALATWFARTLTALPSNIKTPHWFAEQAYAAARSAGLGVEVLRRRELMHRGFGALVAVGAGSDAEPHLVTVRYEPPGRKRRRHVVIVGKGITFDTGGLSIKHSEAMLGMRTDMAGAAVALAVVLAASAARLPHRVTAVLPLAENAVDGAAYRPGDVLRTYGGTTVEIVNTDAEGRLILADALSHADADLAPDVLVDVATLTGAATLGLGRHRGALLTADDALAHDFRVAGEASGEPVWRFPLVGEYAGALDSEIADVCHVGDPDAGGGAITAALFLQRFVGKRRWAHLDIAGPARMVSGRDHPDITPTGFGARLLLRWLESL